jgi:hypothetical protein
VYDRACLAGGGAELSSRPITVGSRDATMRHGSAGPAWFASPDAAMPPCRTTAAAQAFHRFTSSLHFIASRHRFTPAP